MFIISLKRGLFLYTPLCYLTPDQNRARVIHFSDNVSYYEQKIGSSSHDGCKTSVHTIEIFNILLHWRMPQLFSFVWNMTTLIFWDCLDYVPTGQRISDTYCTNLLKYYAKDTHEKTKQKKSSLISVHFP